MKKMLTTKPRWVLLILAFLGMSLQTYADTEPNNTPATAENAPFGSLVNGTLNQAPVGDLDDYYLIVAPSDGDITVTANIGGGLVVYVHIYDKTGAGNAQVYSSGATVNITKYCMAADTFLVRIDHSSGAGSYSFTTSVAGSAYANDTEDNGSIANSTQFISEGQSVEGHIGYYDADMGYDDYDYFGVVLPEDGSYTFRAIRDLGKTSQTFYFNVRRKDGTLLTNLYSNSDTTYAIVNCLAADTVYMQLDSYLGCGGYTLSFENTTPPGTPNDFEDNGSIANVTQFISAGESVEGHIGYFDVDLGYDDYDYFGVILPEDGSYTFRAIRDLGKTSQTFYFNVRRKDASLLVNTYSSTDTTYAIVDCLAADTVYIQLDSYYGCGGYTLSFELTELTYGNDSGDNESIAEASLVPTSSVNEGHLGYYDVDTGLDGFDFYKFTVVQVPFDMDIKVHLEETLNAYVVLYNSAGSLIQNEYHTPGSYNYTRTITEAGDYYIGLDHYSGCGSYSLGNFCANAPEVSITADGPTDICPGESVLLTATAGLSAYSWLRNGIEVSTAQIYLASDPGTYVVIGYDINGCDGPSEEVIIGVFDVPEVSVSTDEPTTFCVGGSITLTATAGFDAYEWSNGANTQSIEVSESGDFSVTATTTDGCDKVSSNSVLVTVLIDSDGDGVCDVDDSCPDLFGQVGDACDDNNILTENDVITADCECVGTPVPAAFNGSVNWNSNCANRDAIVTFYTPNTATIAASYVATVNAAGDFSLPDVLVGTYDVIVNVPGYLNKGIADVVTVAGPNAEDFGTIIGGDVNNNNVINILDISLANNAFNTAVGNPNYILFADVNCSGTINILDVSAINFGFALGGATAPLP